jgi:hypothetical protein
MFTVEQLMKYPALKDMITKMDQKNGEIIDSCVDVTINATMIPSSIILLRNSASREIKICFVQGAT